MAWPLLVCPGCRSRDEHGLSVRTLERQGDVYCCECSRRYPIISGIPLLLRDPSGFVHNELGSIVEGELAAEAQAALANCGDDDAPYSRMQEHLSIYLDAHWGDRAAPAPDGPGASFGAAELVAKVAERRSAPVDLAVELGCSVGRFVAELARGAAHVVALDLHFGALRRARRALTGAALTYNRRVVGRHYRTATLRAGELAVADEKVTWMCGDALDPPLLPGQYQRVMALNVLDSVKRPHQLLSVLDALCAPGGELLLSSPYAWQTGIVDEAERLGGDDPAAAIAAILRSGDGLGARYEIEDEAELPWSLRKDARVALSYRVHYLRARKLDEA
jgi:SAM-dependent methyltransferase/uncharacterized protein YbaR (Trm112 family)